MSPKRRRSATEKHSEAAAAALNSDRAHYDAHAPRSATREAVLAYWNSTPAAVLDAWKAADAQLKRVADGAARKAGRPAKPANSNDPLIARLLKDFPNLLTVSVSRRLLTEWLYAHPDAFRGASFQHAIQRIAKAIERAQRKASAAK